jgi:arylsulfatase A-like enzyme
MLRGVVKHVGRLAAAACALVTGGLLAPPRAPARGAPSPWTLPSFASLYTGRFPSRHGAGRVVVREGRRDFTRLDDALPTLAERLAERGYATGAIVGNAALAPEFGMARGFAGYDYAPATNAFTRRADTVVDRALAWIDARGDAPFFLVVHLFDPHMNYDAPPPYRGRYTAGLPSRRTLPVEGARELRQSPGSVSPAGRRFIAAAYDEEVAFAADQVARLLAALAERGLLGRGLVVLTSDHGEELFEHGGFEHGHALWQEVIGLPLVVWGAGVASGEETAPVSLVDLAPTLLAATGAEPLPDPDGISLWGNLTRGDALPDRGLLAEGSLYGPERKALIRWPLKLVWQVESGERALYELASDPGERAPLADDPRAAALQRELAARVSAPAGAPAELAPETLDALRELGYAE